MLKINVRDTSRVCAAVAALALAGALGTALTGPAAAQPKNALTNFFTEYAVKFVCGGLRPVADLPPTSLLGGNYATAINVHNPGERTVIAHKVAGPTVQGGFTPFASTRPLRQDDVVEFDCNGILAQARMPPGGFVTGFFVIRAPRELDVVAVYTAGPIRGEVASLHTERVPARRVAVPFTLPDLPTKK
jgi:hypothetical protein